MRDKNTMEMLSADVDYWNRKYGQAIDRIIRIRELFDTDNLPVPECLNAIRNALIFENGKEFREISAWLKARWQGGQDGTSV